MVTIKNDKLVVMINTMGAELQSIKDIKGTEYLWQGNPRFWKRRATNLFPFIGRLEEGNYNHMDKSYPMSIHGFAKDCAFKIGEHLSNKVEFILESTPELRGMYPFEFRFIITYELIDNQIDISFKVENLDSNTMYFALGGHPGFNLPIDNKGEFEDYFIEFKESCKPTKINVSKRCFIDGLDHQYKLEGDKSMKLSHDLYNDDAIILKDTSKIITIKNHVDAPEIQVGFPDMKYIATWKSPEPEASYLCIEPWSTLPGREGIVESIETYPDMNQLNSGEVCENKWWIRICN